jgi:hypothetical protein
MTLNKSKDGTMFYNWLNPIFFLLSLFGLAPLMLVDADGNEIEEEEEITDETDIYPYSENVEKADLIFERDDVDIDKFNDAIARMSKLPEEQRHIYLKDIKIDSDAPAPGSKTDRIDKEVLKDTSKPDADELEDPTKKLEAAGDKNPPEVKPLDATKTFIVDDKFIADSVAKFKKDNEVKIKDPAVLKEMVDDYQRALETVKGDPFNSHNLKMHINAQTYIKNVKTPFAPDWKPDSKITQTPDYIAQATTHKNNAILAKLQDRYDGVDLPLFPANALTDKDAKREFEKELISTDPAEYKVYENTIESAEKEINAEFDRWYYIDKNWESMAADTINSDVTLFYKFLESQKVKPEDLGIPDLTLDDKYYNKFLYENIFYKGKGKTNEDVFAMYNGKYPIVKPFSVYNTLRDFFLDPIISKREEAARIEGYELGKKDTIEPGMSNSKNPGEREIIDVADDTSILDEPFTNESQAAYTSRMDKFLDNTRNKIVGKKK